MKKKVLILCTGNSCRSQMAEGVLRHFGSEHFEVFSAGTRPSIVHPIAIQVMQEIGIDISHHRSKSVDEFHGKAIDYLITVCDHAKETCPIFPAQVKQLHWPFPDPFHAVKMSDKAIHEFRKVRDLIYQRFKAMGESGKIE